jgi:hypothetical protein
MLNNNFSFPIQAAPQAVAENCIVAPFEAAALWIDDCITLLAVLGY